jgi:putative ABC transport system ATP-binding protein
VNAITTKDLIFQYKGAKSIHYPNISCTSEEPVLVHGQSGTGKTTLLHILGGILSGGTGEVNFNGIDLLKLDAKKLQKIRRQQIAIIFQTPHHVASLSVRDNILLGTHGKIDEKHFTKIITSLQIDHLIHKQPSEISQGEKQRMTIARALVAKPALVLADEPTSALDNERADSVIQLLLEQTKNIGSCLITVTHDDRMKAYFKKSIYLA